MAKALPGTSTGSASTPSLRRSIPLFLALVYFLFGYSHMAVKVVQQGIDLISCLLVYGIGRELVNPRAGLAAALLFAAYPAYTRYSLAVMTETLFLFLLIASLFLLARTTRSGASADALVAGLVTGLSVLVRPAGGSVVPGALALLARDRRRAGKPLVLLYLAGTLLPVALWLFRNLLRLGGLYFAEVGPRQLWTGSNPAYGGAPFSRAAWAELLWRDPWASELDRGRRMLREALAFMLDDPERYLRYLIWRFGELWTMVSHVPAAEPDRWARLVSAPFAAVETVALPLGLLGFVRSLGQGRATALLATTSLTSILFHVVFGSDHRYRLPFDVIWLIYGGAFLALLSAIRTVDWRDFSLLGRPDPPSAPPRGAHRGRRVVAGVALALGLLLVAAFSARVALVSPPTAVPAAVDPRVTAALDARLRTLGLLDAWHAAGRPGYGDVRSTLSRPAPRRRGRRVRLLREWRRPTAR
jgi:4-amino-4-deoxy-L-arabinose transferase-like glycosyltransferase